MKHKTRSFTLLILITALHSPAAFAYLDPGTGSLILQGLIAAIAGSILTIKLYWYKIKGIWQRLLHNKNNTNSEQAGEFSDNSTDSKDESHQ